MVVKKKKITEQKEESKQVPAVEEQKDVVEEPKKVVKPTVKQIMLATMAEAIKRGYPYFCIQYSVLKDPVHKKITDQLNSEDIYTHISVVQEDKFKEIVDSIEGSDVVSTEKYLQIGNAYITAFGSATNRMEIVDFIEQTMKSYPRNSVLVSRHEFNMFQLNW